MPNPVTIRGTQAYMDSLNPIIPLGEAGLATDTGVLKEGDGVTSWAFLEAFTPPVPSPAATLADIAAASAAVVDDAIDDGDTTTAPSENAVYDALALKEDISALGTMAFEAAADYTPTAGLATVAISGDYVDLSNTPTLGTAAALDVGTGANNIVQLDGTSKLPAVDGSQLTNLPSGASAIDDLSDAITDYVNKNMFLGSTAGDSVTSGQQNTGLGLNSLTALTTGTGNTGIGDRTLATNIAGDSNTAVGELALFTTTASNNTAIGFQAGYTTGSGNENVSVGSLALSLNDTGAENTAVGYQALYTHASGVDNVAIGWQAMSLATAGDENVAVGYQTLQNVTGSDNTAIGSAAGTFVTTGAQNTLVGAYSGDRVDTGADNTTVGFEAGQTIEGGSNNICIGAASDVDSATAANRIAIGYSVTNTADNTAVIGNAFITDVTFGDGTALLHADGSALTNIGAYGTAESTVAVNADPFTYQNTNAYNVDVIHDNTTFSSADWSRDGVTFYNLVTGPDQQPMVRLSPGDSYKVTGGNGTTNLIIIPR